MTNEQINETALITLGIGVLVFYVLIVTAGWKVFKKAGEKGWKAIIPIYDLYIFMKIAGMKWGFWVSILVTLAMAIAQAASNYTPNLSDGILSFDYANHPVASVTISIAYVVNLMVDVFWAIKMSKVFGHGTGYAIGLAVLPNIFLLILGFGSSKYNKKALNS